MPNDKRVPLGTIKPMPNDKRVPLGTIKPRPKPNNLRPKPPKNKPTYSPGVIGGGNKPVSILPIATGKPYNKDKNVNKIYKTY